MRRWEKRWLAAILVFIMAMVCMPSVNVLAKGETWRHPGDTWHYLEGTNIKVQIANDVIRVTGDGAIPDYDVWSLYERPWHTSSCHYLFIDDTITSIGSYAFAQMDTLQYIHMSTKTFIKDTTTFDKIAYMPVFRLYGYEETTQMIGTVPYTSLDSIKTIAQSNWNGACYILDDEKTAKSFQESTNPTIQNVFQAKDTKAPWNKLTENENGNVYTAIGRLAPAYADPSIVVTMQKRYQGRACYEAYAAFIGTNTLAETYQMTVARGNQTLYQTATPYRYVLSIPTEYQAAGRTFSLLAIGNGTVLTLEDLDSAVNTITFETTTPTTAYALVYR